MQEVEPHGPDDTGLPIPTSGVQEVEPADRMAPEDRLSAGDPGNHQYLPLLRLVGTLIAGAPQTAQGVISDPQHLARTLTGSGQDPLSPVPPHSSHDPPS